MLPKVELEIPLTDAYIKLRREEAKRKWDEEEERKRRQEEQDKNFYEKNEILNGI